MVFFLYAGEWGFNRSELLKVLFSIAMAFLFRRFPFSFGSRAGERTQSQKSLCSFSYIRRSSLILARVACVFPCLVSLLFLLLWLLEADKGPSLLFNLCFKAFKGYCSKKYLFLLIDDGNGVLDKGRRPCNRIEVLGQMAFWILEFLCTWAVPCLFWAL